MGKLFVIIGKSASGKDKLYSFLLQEAALGFKPLIPYTTRPPREGEVDGESYHFTTKEEMRRLRKERKIAEERVYHTMEGDWFYFTVIEGADLEHFNYLCIGTLRSYTELRDSFGRDRVVPVYIEVSDHERLLRAIERESHEKQPNYKEVCRRFVADCDDFSESVLKEAGVKRRFSNDGDRKSVV